MTAVGNGWRGGMIFTIAGLSGFGVRVTVAGVVMGLRMYSFIDVMIDCLNCVPSVALNGAAFNPSWHLTAVAAVSFIGKSQVGGCHRSAVAQLFSLGDYILWTFKPR